MGKGIVIKSTGSRYRVLGQNGEITECVIKGRFRIKEINTTNPIAVGDHVRFTIEQGKDTGIITEIEERKNYIIRKASNLSKQYHIIAANIDQVLLMVTIKMPETQQEFIDRFLATSEAYRIKTFIIFNKTDLYNDVETTKMNNLINLYSKIGYCCFGISVKTGENISALVEILKDKITLVAGNSGVGKSSLLNYLNPSLNLKTEEISTYHEQGKHITTFPEMHAMPFGGFIIDTPGIRAFGIIDMEKNEIYHFFPEIFRKSAECKFHNCLHVNEPGCAVRQALETGEIDRRRYRSYLNILEDENRKYR
ncbi:MAG TPA: ribosome small subunit-dependent GTPase A [Bacteroidales bacterium]|nr:ribosome small subunit-dependent GTPase A [Bacteroidales bacterium]HOU96090.1 ribosome small subunit-dependent GTPase A [Bacteroidales bacterium]HQG36672.1 ribosome small subunit-dependent GTPase A [Bacteroidales bacterium]HQG52185.1 ribosome small subunit-dependent GTPase A [Bacteroidales bacterium]HQJ19971.1 ribosome small subunit-dependent GTPase A [Bacteroidales bacterium]